MQDFLCVITYCVLFNFSWKLVAAIGAGAAAAVVGFPLVIAGLGFAPAGILGGNIAAWMMSLYGGTVLSGSIVAVLQSIGAVGMGSVATAIVGAIGATAGGTTHEVFKRMLKDEHEKEELVKGLATCLMGPCGGGLSKERAPAVLTEFGRHGINAIGNEAEKTGLKKCLKTIALKASEHQK